MGVARGYLNRPELTAEKFIPDPFSSDPTSRLYKTGDRARYLPDGNIEFLGRMDDQVKIRGYRIELGEIETVLGQHSSLREAVVLAREDSPGDRRLVAYVVTAGGSAPSANDLRSFLQQKLPEYMVPSVFVFLDSLPLTPNGKLDRKALPAPDQTRPELEETFVAPRTPVEETLASIWAAVLKVDKVGIHDNFFELGGHSLLATQLISRIRETFKIDLPLRSLFEAPTIYGLAQRMQELGEKQEVRPGTKITPVAREQFRVQQTK
jgi:acyl carrier protein